jgi:hypothetical protein
MLELHNLNVHMINGLPVLRGVIVPPFTLTDVERLRVQEPTRRRFVESSDDLNANGSYTLGFKFDTVSRLFQKETGLATMGGRYGPWSNFTDKKQIEIAQDWKSRRNELVFLRDNLVLQLHFKRVTFSVMAAACDGLMSAPPS